MLQIKKINIQGFYSYEDASLDFSNLPPINLIEGKNLDTKGSNGAGKSTLFEAIIWGLTGKTLRRSTEDAIVNFNTGSKCEVIVEVNDYIIVRGKRPSKLQFFHKGVEISELSQKETQDKINTVLGIEFKSLVSTMVYGQNSPTEFLGASADEKRTIIKNFLNLEEVFQLRAIAKSEKLKLSGEIKAQESLIKSLEEEVTDLKASIKKEPPSPPEIDLDEVLKNEKKTRDLKQKLSQYIMESDSLKRELKQIKDPDENCYVCGSPLNPGNRIMILSENHRKRKEIQEKIDTKLEVIKNCEENLNAIPTSTLSSREIIAQQKLFQDLSDKQRLEHDLTKAQKLLSETKSKASNLKLDSELFKFWEGAFSETGLIRYIIRNILQRLNDIVNHYLKILTRGKYTIFFDDQLKETLFYQNKIVHYISLSGGEKNRIDLAVMLGLQQLPVLLNKQTLNIILFDEIGGFLDEDGIECLYILLKELKNSHQLFIITHDSKLKEKLDKGSKLVVVKENSASRIDIIKGIDS